MFLDLHVAGHHNYEESCFKSLLAAADGTDAPDNTEAVRRGLLVVAARFNCVAVAELLLDARTDVGMSSLALETALDTASSREHFGVCEVIQRRAEQELCRARQRLAFAQTTMLVFDILGEIPFRLPPHAVALAAGLTQTRPQRTSMHEAIPPPVRRTQQARSPCWGGRQRKREDSSFAITPKPCAIYEKREKAAKARPRLLISSYQQRFFYGNRGAPPLF